MGANIFISFASQDRKVAMTLCSALESRGFKCWISARDIQPGENFQSAIVRAIRQAKIMLLVFTSNSNNSEEMNKELALASQSKLIVVPLRIEDVSPNDAFAYEFATRQWIDFFADWEFAIQQLAQR
ncbi:MAG TPA: toll/interleukin-1 receptor domain-containing protein, partial [Phenylobacterium sp.]|uniref:toll/interleukin-1 receptor domain-containing protein n=1 Tax=Phenylobacterium sp. TaxID=1871053 RepID=UPI002CDBE9EB